MNVKLILKKLAEINNKADKNHTHENINSEILELKNRVMELEKLTSGLLYFEEIERSK
jgi:hypothetical protein